MVEIEPDGESWKRCHERAWSDGLDELERILREEDARNPPPGARTMSIESAAIGAYGVLTEPTTLTIQRLLPGPIERVWAYLTESDLRRQWLAAGRMEMEAGSEFELVWRNEELSNPRGQRPAGFPEEDRMQSRITEVDPPRRLSFTWQGSGDVTFELEPIDGEVLLTVIHRRLPDRRTLLEVGAGWHMHLDILVDRFAEREPEPFWDGWNRLHEEYDRRLPR